MNAPKVCCEECFPICDFCRFYNFNGDKDGAYTGNGYCVKHEIRKEPDDCCKDFICNNYKRTDIEE